MMIKKQKNKIQDYQAIVLLVIIGIQTLYAGIKGFGALFAIIGLDIKLLSNLLVLFAFAIYAAVIYIGVCFFRGRPSGWYGVTSLHIILSIKNIIILISTIFALAFKDFLLKYINLPVIKINSNILWSVFELFISVVTIKLLFSTDTINGFDLKINSRLHLTVKVIAIVLLCLSLYFGISFLLL